MSKLWVYFFALLILLVSVMAGDWTYSQVGATVNIITYNSTDTNASTACRLSTEYLSGTGTCQNASASDTNTQYTTDNNSVIMSGTEVLLNWTTMKRDLNYTTTTTDTNASTACSDGEFLKGDGTCVNETSLNTNSTTWWNYVSGWVAKWFVWSGSDLSINETTMQSFNQTLTNRTDEEIRLIAQEMNETLKIEEVNRNHTVDTNTYFNNTCNGTDVLHMINGTDFQCIEQIDTDTQTYLNASCSAGEAFLMINGTDYRCVGVNETLWVEAQNYVEQGEIVINTSAETRWTTNQIWIVNVSGSLESNQTTLQGFNNSVVYNETPWVQSQNYQVAGIENSSYHRNVTPSNVLDWGFSGNCSVAGSCGNVAYFADFMNQGDFWINGSLFILGNITSVDVNEVALNGSFLPSITNLFSIGSNVLKWLNGFFAGDVNATNFYGSDFFDDGTNINLIYQTAGVENATYHTNTTKITHVSNLTDAQLFNQSDEITALNVTITPHTNISEVRLQPFNQSDEITALNLTLVHKSGGDVTGTLNASNITQYAGFRHCFDADCNSTIYFNGSGLIIRG